MTLFWTETWDALAGVLFPTPCVSCGGLIAAHDPPLCRACWDLLPRNLGGECRCGALLPGFPADHPDPECGRCRRGRSMISRGASLGPYAGPLRACVVALKYHGRHKTADRLAQRLFEKPRCRRVLDDADVLLGVPLHADRLTERGFNQAGLLAEGLARLSGTAVCAGLARVRNTPSQTSLSARQRRRNMADAFAVADPRAIHNSVAVLVDDVATTGATLRECAHTLLRAGAREVRAITVARAE